MDQQISMLRNWISKRAGGGPVWGRAAQVKGLPPRLAPAELFDVYESHTKNCKNCQVALKNVRLVRNLSLVFAAVAAVVIKNTTRALMTSGALGLVALLCHKLKGLFYKYEFHHQNNN
jgi:hypothetical protein